MKKQFYKKIYDRLKRQSTESTLGVLGIKSQVLRQHLETIFTESEPGKGSMLADPVFESVFPWTAAEQTFQDLSGNLIRPSLVKALDSPKDIRFDDQKLKLSEQAMKKEWNPYVHQIKAWETVQGEENRSLIVTSGTGSGKTECFMVPILNDLVQQSENGAGSLEGVQALFIYPLNALINSQRERLLAWTQPFKQNVRFTLYNGNTPEKMPASATNSLPLNEIHTREKLYQSPSPILITNPTMLEYMLIRKQDRPILEKSKGKLKYIVLDEAHTYIGSQAAELALLIRRTLHGFGVKPEDVRFIATSATIGSDEAAKVSLKKYLADIGGISVDSIDIVDGSRFVPALETAEKTNTETVSSILERPFEEQKELVYSSPLAQCIREFCHPLNGARTLSEITTYLNKNSFNITNEETLLWLDLCSHSEMKKDNVHFLPLRGHFFHRVLSGLWGCPNPNCSCKVGTALENREWHFGMVYTTQRKRCACGYPIFELAFCIECNTPLLKAKQDGLSLLQEVDKPMDDFELEKEVTEEELENTEDTPHSTDEVLLSGKNFEQAEEHSMDKEGKLISVLPSKDGNSSDASGDKGYIRVYLASEQSCMECGNKSSERFSAVRRSILGMPFYNSALVPILLENTPEGKEPNSRPSQGRSLITFTDSRQGTARIAIKMQQDAERNRSRGLIYRALVENTPDNSEHEAKLATLTNIPNWEDIPGIPEMVEQLKSKLSETPAISWNQMIEKISSNDDIKKYLKSYYVEKNPVLFSTAENLTTSLLLREFLTRPRRQNSLETLGLVNTCYPALEKIKSAPSKWTDLNFTLEEWKQLLKVILDFHVRAGMYVNYSYEFQNWLADNFRSNGLLPPDTKHSEKNNKVWPAYKPERKERQTRVVRYIAKLLQYDITSQLQEHEADTINQLLGEAWNNLTAHSTRLLTSLGDNIYKLNPEQMSFELTKKTYLCPITMRMLDCTIRNITPYLPLESQTKNKNEILCSKLIMPTVPVWDETNEDTKRELTRKWTVNNEGVTTLRKQGIWGNLHDTIVEGARLFRAEEHSAQLGADRLKYFEKRFKEGHINVLSCSTTMEMGVDIGGLSIVMNNNVPPHPSNYLQRAGRAGRRGESQSMSMTLCKDNPLDKEVFLKPTWPFKKKMKQPNITLQSERIVLRHINAFLFSYFLNEQLENLQVNKIRLNCRWFFVTEEGRSSFCDQFIEWIKSLNEENKDIISGFETIRAKTILENESFFKSKEKAVSILQRISQNWLNEYDKLESEYTQISTKKEERDPFALRIKREMSRMEKGYLLQELVTGGFLPGYGFPTGIVSFNCLGADDFNSKNHFNDKEQREDNNFSRRSMPSRGIAIALNEYAPGSQIVIDGQVYESRGLSLNWQIPMSITEVKENQKIETAWRCSKCGYVGISKSTFSNECTACGNPITGKSKRLEFIEPTGFATDFYSSPTNNINTRKFIPSKEPWIVANSELKSLPNPLAGYYKSDTLGRVFYHNAGEHEKGYALCLNCGYADSMTDQGKLPKNFREHKKLRGQLNSDKSNNTSNCGASDFQIKQNIVLGADVRTDVFELFVKHPKTGEFLITADPKNRDLCWTLAVALRQALARTLGINTDEIGVNVAKRKIEITEESIYAICLYDKNSGGSGFSTLAPLYIQDIVEKASEVLDCPAQCADTCEHCLTQSDTRTLVPYLNRYLALAFLNSGFVQLLALPQEEQILGNNSKYCIDSIDLEIGRIAGEYNQMIQLPIGSEYEKWNLMEPSFINRLQKWGKQFETVQLLIDCKSPDEIDVLRKEQLVALKNVIPNLQILQQQSQAVQELSDGYLIALLQGKDKQVALATKEAEAILPDLTWGNTHERALIKAEVKQQIDGGSNMDNKQLQPQVDENTFIVNLHKQLNGRLVNFGANFWNTVEESAPGLIDKLKNMTVENIEYTDRYLHSPLSVCLLHQVLSKMPTDMQNACLVVETMKDEKSFASNGYRYVNYNWACNEQDAKTEFAQKLLSTVVEEQVDVYLEVKKDKLAHGREIIFEFSNGESLKIILDQGFGYWKAVTGPEFAFEEDVETQLEWVETESYDVSVINQPQHPCYIVAQWID